MAKTEVILTHNIVGLGGESDHVKVAAGYARNYLFPQRLAIPFSGANQRQLDALKRRRAEREAHDYNAMLELSHSLEKLPPLVIKVKTGDDGKMFGSVTSGAIADELRTHFDIKLDRKKIALPAAIRTLGDHEVHLKLHSDIAGVLKVRVESTTPAPAAEVSYQPSRPTRGAAPAAEKSAPKAEAKPEPKKRAPRKSA
ncbi:MAG: 50S ribosomal protein L9 [Pedosphaera sp.]|nr:50S ribosomal protein L9 [Pedosphaera sp.]